MLRSRRLLASASPLPRSQARWEKRPPSNPYRLKRGPGDIGALVAAHARAGDDRQFMGVVAVEAGGDAVNVHEPAGVFLTLELIRALGIRPKQGGAGRQIVDILEGELLIDRVKILASQGFIDADR